MNSTEMSSLKIYNVIDITRTLKSYGTFVVFFVGELFIRV